tara:strand:- start:1 stop:915 length:915 start_codon:yes stop_codon:yes gene_type:complete
MKISLYTQILPRIELPFLDEWIAHHLQLGVSHIYIYNNGEFPLLVPRPKWNIPRSKKDPRITFRQKEKFQKETPHKWLKKPDLDYNEDLTYQEILNELHLLEVKYFPFVHLIPWAPNVDHTDPFPYSQRTGYHDCVKKHASEWWLCIDPDEYLHIGKWKNLEAMIAFFQDGPVRSLRFRQKLFQERRKGEPVREIFESNYLITRSWKGLVKGISFKKERPHSGNAFLGCKKWADGSQDIYPPSLIHAPRPRKGSIYLLKFKEACIHHYRGDPEPRQRDKFLQRRKSSRDCSMNKYLVDAQDNEG